jgi:hypothetical protein
MSALDNGVSRTETGLDVVLLHSSGLDRKQVKGRHVKKEIVDETSNGERKEMIHTVAITISYRCQVRRRQR